MDSPSALVLVNSHSRHGTDRELSDVLSMLENAGVGLYPVTLKNRQQTEATITEYRDKIDRVFVAGGDGTLNTLAPHLYRQGLPVGILPLGTANDLARTLSIPLDLREAARVLIDDHRQKIDLGKVNDLFYFNVAHIGLGTEVNRELTSAIKKRWGVFSYSKALFSALARTRRFRATIVVDGHRYRLRTIHVTIGNGTYYGGGYPVAESASIDDGLLSLYSVKPDSVWKLLKLAPVVLSGRQQRSKEIFNTSGRRIEMRTSPKMPVHADGEQLTKTPAVFEVVERALEVFVPPPGGRPNSPTGA